MLRFYVRWRNKPAFCPETEEEREKFTLEMLKATTADLQAGLAKDWGFCVDGSGGYSVYKVSREADLFCGLQKWRRRVDFDVKQVLTIEQAIESAEQAIEKRKKPPYKKGKQTS